MGKTNEKIIVFYRAEYPDIDPNIVYTYEELIGEGYYIGTKDVSQFEDETKYHFGIPVRLKVKEFDYDKIKIMKEDSYMYIGIDLGTTYSSISFFKKISFVS